MGNTTFSLRDLGISPGQARTEQLDLELVPYHQAGEDYAAVGGSVPATLDVTAMTEGTSFRLRFSAVYAGPCARCLEPASLAVEVDSHEVHDPSVQPGDEAADELRSAHVDDAASQLDVTGWAQEAVGLQFPSRVLCRQECKGLCGECGINLNKVEGEHVHERPPDSRWDALRDLQLDDDGSA